MKKLYNTFIILKSEKKIIGNFRACWSLDEGDIRAPSGGEFNNNNST